MRIAISLATIRPGAVGGAETYVRGLIAEFSHILGDGELTILGNEEVAYEYGRTFGQDKVVRLPGMATGGKAWARALRLGRAALAPGRILGSLDGQFDVTHFPIAVAVPRPARSKIVVTLHDVLHHVHPGHVSRAARIYRWAAYDRSAKQADLVITVSENARSELLAHLDLAPERVVAIHNGIDHSSFTPDVADVDAEARAQLELPELFAYYPANYWRHKNHATLFRALRTVREDVTLVLTGSLYGKDDELRHLAEAAGVAHRVRHLGRVPYRYVPALYRAASCLVFPSLFEGFGYPPLEAMACGCGVAVAAGGSLREVCGDAARYFEPDDPAAISASIETVISEAGEPIAAARGRDQAKRFTWDKAAAAHIRAYALVLGHR